MKRGISSAPQHVDRHLWYYETKEGIDIVHRIMVEKMHLRTDICTIPWNMVVKSVERYNNTPKE